MTKVSIIIPSRREHFLTHTINDLISKAAGDVEVIAVLDGYWPQPPDQLPLPEHPNLRVLHFGQARGMRAAINGAASIAKGEFLMKCDAHCLFGEGYDEILKADCDDNWLVIPSRYSLDYNEWKIANTGKARVDYHYLSCPLTNPDGFSMHGQVWNARARANLDVMIDDEMSFQGSCWFTHKAYFDKAIGGMSEVGYGSFTQEPQELGMKYWLGGGRIVVNKKTYYAHLHKGKVWGRGYKLAGGEVDRGHKYSAAFWTSNLWKDRVHDFEWLIDKFWPVPTWHENWRDELAARQDEIRGYL